MRYDESRFRLAASEFWRSFPYSSVYLSHHLYDSDILYKSVSSAKKDTGVDEMVHDFSSGFYGLILYLENVPLFSGRTTYELLLQQCSQLFFQDFCDKIIS